MSEKEIYEVLECKDYTGLTVGSKVLKPGQKFEKRQWPYSDKALEAATKDNRCKRISSGKKDDKKKD